VTTSSTGCGCARCAYDSHTKVNYWYVEREGGARTVVAGTLFKMRVQLGRGFSLAGYPLIYFFPLLPKKSTRSTHKPWNLRLKVGFH
jgi:hypothetical protein